MGSGVSEEPRGEARLTGTVPISSCSIQLRPWPCPGSQREHLAAPLWGELHPPTKGVCRVSTFILLPCCVWGCSSSLFSCRGEMNLGSGGWRQQGESIGLCVGSSGLVLLLPRGAVPQGPCPLEGALGTRNVRARCRAVPPEPPLPGWPVLVRAGVPQGCGSAPKYHPHVAPALLQTPCTAHTECPHPATHRSPSCGLLWGSDGREPAAGTVRGQ